MKVIVHADDLGLTEKINEGILQAHINGILTSTSLMANGEAFDQAVSLARATPTLDVGIHLTLVEEKPIMNAEAVSTLVDSNGRLHQHAIEFAKKYLWRRIDLEEVRLELEAQIQKVLATGISPTHLDSHQHLHVLPGLLEITLELSHQYHVPAIRLPREVGILRKASKVGLRRILECEVLNLLCWVGKKKVQRTTGCFSGFLFGGNLNKKNLLTVLRELPDGATCEIMCHPGLEGLGSRYAHWGYHWSDELNALLDEDVREFVRSEGIQLISYRELSQSGDDLLRWKVFAEAPSGST